MPDRYANLKRGLGAELRMIFATALRDARDLPTRSQLAAQLAEALPGERWESVRAALTQKFREAAEIAQDRQRRFELRQQVDEFLSGIVDELDKGERIIPLPDEEPVDLDAVLKHVRDPLPLGPGAARG
ncbi:MAG: hypothetical protein ACM33U_09170 [Solirubrobacterales bacterium]|nr:hypothetical protein [Solirubrobacterales bacterium]